MSTKSKPTTDQPTFRNNAEVDAKINAHIKENPEHWNWLKSLPRERLERMLILNEVRHLDRQQNVKKSILDRVEADPDKKQAYEILMKDVPEDQRADLISQLEKRKWRANQSITQSQRPSPAVRV
jgi:hypothetical protein